MSKIPGIIYHFQPIVSPTDGNIAYYEMLLRVSQSQLNGCNIESFISNLELTGKIVSLDRQGVLTALRMIKSNSFSMNIPIAINISPDTIHSKNFMSFLEDCLSRSHNPELLYFEITERTEIKDITIVSRFINIVHDYGGKVAIDDFGSGYTNFDLIENLDLDYIKIDGQYIMNMDLDFIKRVSEAAGKKNIAVVAERIETVKEMLLVKPLVDWVQGYFIAKPSAIPLAINNTREVILSAINNSLVKSNLHFN